MSKQVAELREQLNWHWRNSMRPVRFFGFDAKAAIPFMVLLLHARLTTLIFCILVVALFWFLEKRGLTFPAAMRSTRHFFFGNFRPAWASHKYRRLKDYG